MGHVPVDHYPLLFACFTLMDKVTNGLAFEIALEETCAYLALNHAQQHVLRRAYDVLTFQDQPPMPTHHGVHWG